ncbi:hypothetical protein [Streptococcus himalayensis]|uniref:Uncharacterized protein n=1 Tax=Streptococcus himalayensis TaxID=1888195 RepID=A0A917A899_9STRE|nr:hypothetical protein [Streptococcus himalayensis]GGE33511.1 hypothetical protein GCM10011510_13610 [Streptococcus himalayensis]
MKELKMDFLGSESENGASLVCGVDGCMIDTGLQQENADDFEERKD